MPKKEKREGFCPDCGAPVEVGDVVQCTVCNWQKPVKGEE